jgi:hypothetical protein
VTTSSTITGRLDLIDLIDDLVDMGLETYSRAERAGRTDAALNQDEQARVALIQYAAMRIRSVLDELPRVEYPSPAALQNLSRRGLDPSRVIDRIDRANGVQA